MPKPYTPKPFLFSEVLDVTDSVMRDSKLLGNKAASAAAFAFWRADVAASFASANRAAVVLEMDHCDEGGVWV